MQTIILYEAQLCLTSWTPEFKLQRVTQNVHFLLLTHTKQLLLMTFCDTLAGIEVSFWGVGTGTETTEPRMDRQTWKLK